MFRFSALYLLSDLKFSVLFLKLIHFSFSSQNPNIHIKLFTLSYHSNILFHNHFEWNFMSRTWLENNKSVRCQLIQLTFSNALKPVAKRIWTSDPSLRSSPCNSVALGIFWYQMTAWRCNYGHSMNWADASFYLSRCSVSTCGMASVSRMLAA